MKGSRATSVHRPGRAEPSQRQPQNGRNRTKSAPSHAGPRQAKAAV